MTADESKSLLIELDRVESLQKSAAKAENRREYPRASVRAEVILHRTDRTGLDRAPIEAALRDIGVAGAGLLTNEPVRIGSTWRCEFLKDGHVIGTQCFLVRYCDPVAGGAFLIGGSFVVDTAVLYLLDVENKLNLASDEDDYRGAA